MSIDSTIKALVVPEPLREDPIPGVVLVFSVGAPRCSAIRVDGGVVLGRGTEGGAHIDDQQMSRKHARIAFDGAAWTVEDLGSTNGTWVDGATVRGEVRRESFQVVRAGASLFLLLPDIREFVRRGGVRVVSGSVLGPMLQEKYDAIGRAALAGDNLLVTGESGTGKELAARAFHRSGPQARGPFVAVNCAAIPEGLAERLLFGARRGAYSGATHDTEGYVQAAHGGTLFLDEVAELEIGVQAKLLRTIDTQQVLELGAVAPRPVQVRVCAATHDLRARVSAGRFRDDLYYRIGKPEVRLPPLRERREEIPFLLVESARRADERDPPALDVLLVQECLLRPWPGNVREFIGEARRAATRALEDGRRLVEARDLDPSAGIGLVPVPTSVEARSSRTTQPIDAMEGRGGPAPPDDAFAEALRHEKGNVSRAAQRLGVHRNKVRRWLEKNRVERSYFAQGEPLPDDD